MRACERLLRGASQLRTLGVAVLLATMLPTSPAQSANSSRQILTLEVPRETERSTGWDQVAVASMLFRYYGLVASHPSAYQCGVIAAVMRGREAESCRESCAGCRFDGQSPETLEQVFRQYPTELEQTLGAPRARLHTTVHREPLPRWGVKSQITKGRPFIVLLQIGDQNRSLLVAGFREFDRKIDLLLVDPSDAGEQLLRQLGAIQAEAGLGWWMPYQALIDQLGWKQTVTVSAEGAVTQPVPRAPPAAPSEPPPPSVVARVQKCCVQSMYGPASCPLIGGPYQVGWSCHCQLGGEKRVVTGVVCESK